MTLASDRRALKDLCDRYRPRHPGGWSDADLDRWIDTMLAGLNVTSHDSASHDGETIELVSIHERKERGELWGQGVTFKPEDCERGK